MEYASSSEDEAKRALMRVFFLGTPQCDVPFLWSLAGDVAQGTEVVLSQPQNTHLRAFFCDRPHPVASRLFYALSPVEDDLLHDIAAVCIDQQWAPRAYIFDELVFDTAAPASIVEETMAQLEEVCGYSFKLTKPCVQPLVGQLLLQSGRGQRGAVLARWDGTQQCLYDAISHVFPDCPEPPSDGPHVVRSLNNPSDHSSQRDAPALWLEEVADMWWRRDAMASGQQALARYAELICWQPYEADCGHFFAIKVLDAQTVSLHDSSVGCAVSTQTHHFYRVVARWRRCVLQGKHTVRAAIACNGGARLRFVWRRRC